MRSDISAEQADKIAAAAEYARALSSQEAEIYRLRAVNTELLAALQLAVATIQRLNPTGSSTGGTIDVANAAIAKATQI